MKNNWLFDETKHCGIDYSDVQVAKEYDAEHSKFRDFDAEAKDIADKLQVGKGDTVLELGCGTGGLTIPLASFCSRIIGVDVSQPMLELLAEKASSRRITNIETHCAGFLNYRYEAPAVDFIVTKAALHHLPDFWKSVALKKMFDILKPGGRLYLFDVAFSFDVGDYENNIDEWISTMKKIAGGKMAEEAIIHVRDEYSTYDWILDKLLQNAGFRIESKVEEQPNCFTYLCVK